MYVIDEDGQVLIDASIQAEVDKAARTSSLSPRARAITNPRTIDLSAPIRRAEQAFVEGVSALARDTAIELGLVTKANRTIVGQNGIDREIPGLFNRVMERTVVRGLAGFPGPVPVAQFNGWNHIRVIVPSDGALIRYLTRYIRKANLSWLSCRIEPPGARDTITLVDGSNVVVKADTAMYIMLELRPQDYGIPGNNNIPNRMLRSMSIRNNLKGFFEICTTLTRRCYSNDGVWGELPRFPILNYRQKRTSSMDLDLRDARVPTIHGNRQTLFGDLSVYEHMDMFAKRPFASVSNRSGVQFEWKDPRRLP